MTLTSKCRLASFTSQDKNGMMEMFKSEMDDPELLKAPHNQAGAGSSRNCRNRPMKINAKVFAALFGGISLPYVPQTWEERAWFLICLLSYREERGYINDDERKTFKQLDDRVSGRMLVRAVWRLYDPGMGGDMWGESKAGAHPWERSPVGNLMYLISNGYWSAYTGRGRDFVLPKGADFREFTMSDEPVQCSDNYYPDYPAESVPLGLFLFASGILRWTGKGYQRELALY